jgi:hypothetical protein
MNYKKYSDDDLLEEYRTSMDYSGKAEKDLSDEISARGGIDHLIKQEKIKRQFPDEIKRINKIIFDLCKKNISVEAIKTSISSDIIPQHELNEILDKQITSATNYIKDKTITSRTIIGSIVGTLISSILCGAIWSYTIIKTGTMYYILLPGLALISYVILRLLTKQSKNNTLVFIATFLSTFLAVILGLLFYKIVADIR